MNKNSTVQVTKQLQERLSKYCKANGLKVSFLVEKIVEEYLGKVNEKRKKEMA